MNILAFLFLKAYSYGFIGTAVIDGIYDAIKSHKNHNTPPASRSQILRHILWPILMPIYIYERINDH